METRPPVDWPYHWQAFYELSSERQIGFGALGPIPYSAVRNMAKEDGLSPHETNVLHYVVRLLDARQRELAAERAEKQAKKAGK